MPALGTGGWGSTKEGFDRLVGGCSESESGRFEGWRFGGRDAIDSGCEFFVDVIWLVESGDEYFELNGGYWFWG